MHIETSSCPRLEEILPGLRIVPVEAAALEAAQRHIDQLTKPRGSLGRLEELARRLAAMRPEVRPLNVSPAMMLTVAGDHGVTAQGVSPCPQIVTRQMVANFCAGGAGVNVLSRTSGMDLRVVDAGCAGGPYAPHPQLIDLRLGDGTADMSRGPAMSRETCLTGLRRGVELVRDLAARGYACFATGEMGIGNSTAAAAVNCALLGFAPERAVGPGAGADSAMIARKAEVVRTALAVNGLDPAAHAHADPLAVLAAVCGFEIVLMAGIMLGAASCRLPVLVDGFICSAAYAAAERICPTLADYAILAHASAEPGHVPAVSRLAAGGPLLHLDMRLGEGTGAAVAYHLLRCAAAIYNDMATFASAQVSSEGSLS